MLPLPLRVPQTNFILAKNQGHYPRNIRNQHIFLRHHIQYTPSFSQYTHTILTCGLNQKGPYHNCKIPYTHRPQTFQQSFFTQYTSRILACMLTYKESCHKCGRSWYFPWPTLKYTYHYADLIHSASSLYLSYTDRYAECLRPKEGSLYGPFCAV